MLLTHSQRAAKTIYMDLCASDSTDLMALCSLVRQVHAVLIRRFCPMQVVDLVHGCDTSHLV